MNLVVRERDTPKSLVAWAEQALSDEIVISRVAFPHPCQGVQAAKGDWMVEFDGQFGVLFRPAGDLLMCVARNDGEPLEHLPL